MITNISANRELENYDKEDTFDFKPKAEAIKSFLEFNTTTLEKNKMIVLYGDWGSGKTSLMKHIEKKINRKIYFPIFFHAWEFEKDENLAVSLCDSITKTLKDSKPEIIQKLKDFRAMAFSTLKGFASGLNIKLGGTFYGAEVNFDVGKVFDALEKGDETEKDLSHFSKNEKFKIKFKEIEREILTKNNAEKVLVFIDDLDRCEPENVLNLITALKLFFTYGENTIFFAGLDKEAVSKAVKTKYNDVIKSEEYLEKVFDISFNIPKTFSLKKYLENRFQGNTKLEGTGISHKNSEIIDDFFVSINFTNPRHIKKILNKYEILKSFKKTSVVPQDLRDLIPDILDDEQGNVFETVFSLYFIILYEFYLTIFERVENYDTKLVRYINAFKNDTKNSKNNVNPSTTEEVKRLLGSLFIDPKVVNLSNYFETDQNQRLIKQNGFASFILIISNDNPEYFTIFRDQDLHRFGDYFNDNSIPTLFCKYLIKHKESIIKHKFSDYLFWNYFSMCKYFL